MYGIFYERNRHFEGTGYRAGRWSWRVGRYQPAGRLRQRQPWREIAGRQAGHGELEVIKRGKEKHNPDGTGDTVKKYL